MNNGNRNIRHLLISNSLKNCSDFYQSPKYRIFFNSIKKINLSNSKFTSILKSKNKSNKKIFFDSFHKSFIHRKLTSNTKYIEIENRICNTDRGIKKTISIEKNSIDNKIKSINKNKKNNRSNRSIIKKIFLTNDNYCEKSKKNLKVLTETESNEPMTNNNNKYINIQSNIFLPFNLKRFRNSDYPEILRPKISDFVEDIKMMRTAKFINNIQIEKDKHTTAVSSFESEYFKIIQYSLKNALKLIQSYNSSFIKYNKFLFNKIKTENKILKNYIINKKILKEQIYLLQKKYDDSILEIKILNNFKNLFIAIKNKTKIEDNNYMTEKEFETKMKEKLKSLSPKKIINYSTKEMYNKRKRFIKSTKMFNNINYKFGFKKMIEIKENASSSKVIMNKSKKKPIINKKKEKNEESEKSYSIDDNNIIRKPKKFHSIFNVNINNKYKPKHKKIERLKSLQPTSFIKINLIDDSSKKENLKVKFDNFNIQKEYKLRVNNILNMIQQYDDIEDYIVYYKLLFEKNNNSIDSLVKRKQVIENIINLNYYKNYNKLLISKYNLLKCQNDDYSFYFLVYNKINEIIDSIKDDKLKKYQYILDKINNIYDNNKIYFQYKNEKKRNKTKSFFLIRELINYIFKEFTLIEKLLNELINGKNNYLKNNYYSEQIEKYENKMDIDKKNFNNIIKRYEEILRRKKINEETIKRWNKIIFMPYRKVPTKFKIKINHVKTEELNQQKENENLLFY